MSDKARKQLYLKENIINAGYDAMAFGQFMASQRENGTDINMWNFAELEELVDHFKQLQSSNLEHPGEPDFNDHDFDQARNYRDPRKESVDSVDKYLNKDSFGKYVDMYKNA